MHYLYTFILAVLIFAIFGEEQGIGLELSDKLGTSTVSVCALLHSVFTILWSVSNDVFGVAVFF